MVFLCKRLLSDSKSLLACKTAEMSWENFWGDVKGWPVLGWDESQLRRTYLIRWYVRRDGMWWDDMRRDEVRRAHMIWDEMKCGVWSAGCEECRVKCEESLLGVALHRGRAQVMFLDNNCATASHKAQRPGWRTAHASSIYRWERSHYNPKVTSAPPRAGTTGKP